jgi:cell division septation protein DedD
MSQDQARGVHLTDKQIVFGVMAATVVVVVAFLCGVFVGRGVRALRPAADAAMTAGAVVPDPVPAAADTGPPAAAGQPATGPAGAGGPLSYPGRLTASVPLAETLPAAQVPMTPPEPPAESTGPDESAGGTSPVAAVPGRPEDTPTGGFTVQVFAVRRRTEAQEIVDRLKKKGFPAYVWTPAPGDRVGGFRVRVGAFSSRQEAEAMAIRLQKEEKFTPWITR